MSANDLDGGGQRRVALLARAGRAREQLHQALIDANAEVALVDDPNELDPYDLTVCAPQVVLVALEPAIEGGLARLEEQLHDPALTVIYDEAELAAQREGWDAQRWVRHLAAKLHGHTDVLPPGREADEPIRPGAPPTPAQLYADARLEPHLEEAFDKAPQLPADGLKLVDEDEPAATAPGAFDIDFENWKPLERTQHPALVDGFGDTFAPEPASEPPESLPPLRADAVPPPLPPLPQAEAAPAPKFSFGELSLVDDDALPAPATFGASRAVAEPPPLPPPLPDEFPFAIEPETPALDGLRLEGPAPAGQAGAARGAVLLFAGIGGPDAVRRILGELPADLTCPVLVHLRLDGGRYDNLVRQMERVSPMPVSLAAPGERASAARVYVVPAEVAATAEQGSVVFVAGSTVAAELIAGLPPAQSAVLLLSGAEVGDVPAALMLATQGAFVAGQSPQGCYDPAAARALQGRGGRTGTPEELAAGLIEHVYG